MEKSNKYVVLSALTMYIICQASSVFAQDEKKIWTACIDSIYHHKETVVIYPHMQYPINPLDPVIDTTNQEVRKYPFVFYIDTKLLEIGEDLIPLQVRWLASI